MYSYIFFFFKQKTAYDMRISDWSSDVCSSDLASTDEGILGQCTAGGVPLVEEVVDPAEQRPVTGEAVIGSEVDHRVAWQLAAALYLVVGLMTVVLVAAHVLRRVRQDAGADSQALIEIPVQPQLEVVLRQAWQIVTAGHANLVVRAA